MASRHVLICVVALGVGCAARPAAPLESGERANGAPRYGELMVLSVGSGEPRDIELAGAIESMTAAERGSRRVTTVTIAGDAPGPERSFDLWVPSDATIPFRVGDEVRFKLSVHPGPPNYRPTDALVTTKDGDLLLFTGAGEPPGWSAARQGVVQRTPRDGYAEVEYAVRIEHGNVAVMSDRMHWQPMKTADGDWRVGALSSGIEGRGPPDAGNVQMLSVLRVSQ